MELRSTARHCLLGPFLPLPPSLPAPDLRRHFCCCFRDVSEVARGGPGPRCPSLSRHLGAPGALWAWGALETMWASLEKLGSPWARLAAGSQNGGVGVRRPWRRLPAAPLPRRRREAPGTPSSSARRGRARRPAACAAAARCVCFGQLCPLCMVKCMIQWETMVNRAKSWCIEIVAYPFV